MKSKMLFVVVFTNILGMGTASAGDHYRQQITEDFNLSGESAPDRQRNCEQTAGPIKLKVAQAAQNLGAHVSQVPVEAAIEERVDCPSGMGVCVRWQVCAIGISSLDQSLMFEKFDSARYFGKDRQRECELESLRLSSRAEYYFLDIRKGGLFKRYCQVSGWKLVRIN